jgi:hypothetical protein
MKNKTIRFKDNQAKAVIVPADISSETIVESLDLPTPDSLLVLNGGTAQLSLDLEKRLAVLLSDGVARFISENQIPIVTGATDAGIFSLLGNGLEKWGRTSPCIGVAVSKKVTWDGRCNIPFIKRVINKNRVDLEPHHSHFILVNKEDWGDETETMYDFIQHYSQNIPSIAIFVGGGSITKVEMLVNVAQGRKMILFAGSGRITDTIISSTDGGSNIEDTLIRQIITQGKIIPFDIYRDPEELIDLIEDLLSEKE